MKSWFEKRYLESPQSEASADGFPSLATKQDPSTVPKSIRESHDAWWDRLSDFGGASIHVTEPPETAFFIFIGTDGDEGGVEFYDADGEFLFAGFLDGFRVEWIPRAELAGRFEFED